MLMVPQRDTSLDEVLTIEDPMDRLNFAIKNELVIERKYFNVAFLQDVNPGSHLVDQRADLPQLNVGEEEGIIVDTVATFRGQVGRYMGTEMSYEQAEEMERLDDNVFIPRFHVYDVRVTGAVATDGPAEREELLASFENEMKARKNEKTQNQLMAESLAKLVEFMGEGQRAPLEAGIVTPEQVMDAMTPEQMREMADLMEKSKPKITRGKK